MIAELIPVDGSPAVRIHRDITLVGRKRGLCDVIVDDSSVSKVHCALAKTDGLLFLRDLGSTNGTRVNGQRVSRGALLPGDELAIANVKFKVHLGPGEPARASSYEATEAFRVAAIGDSRNTLPEHGSVAEVDEDFSPRPDSKTIESDSDVRLLPIESHEEF
ncbi:MAG: FHA domain-containing protein [Planctomycetaceae bacterium]